MADPTPPWSVRLKLHDIQRSSPQLRLEADAGQRKAIASTLDLLDLRGFVADVELKPWLDGVEVTARWRAEVVQTCGVSLDPFETPLTETFTVRAVPSDSAAAVSDEAEVSLDPEAEDPPDLLDGDEIDVGAYLVEHLALEVDPFPRKPGVAFEPPPEETPASPFAVLQKLKRDPGDVS